MTPAATPLRLKRFLDQLLRNGVVAPVDIELVNAGSHVIQTQGGDNGIIKTHIDTHDTTGQHWHQWLDSLGHRYGRLCFQFVCLRVFILFMFFVSFLSRPTMVRFGLRSLAELVEGNTGKRNAMQQAIDEYLMRIYESWRTHQLQHDRNLKVLLMITFLCCLY
jgi:hypothetical protein